LKSGYRRHSRNGSFRQNCDNRSIVEAKAMQLAQALPREAQMVEILRSVTILAMGSVVISAGIFVVLYG